MDEKIPLYTTDFSEEVCIICIMLIAITSIIIMGADSSNIVSAIGGGLVGYLKRGNS